MNPFIASILRHLITKGCGVLLAHGWINGQNDTEMGVAFGLFLATLGWSWLEKKFAQRDAAPTTATKLPTVLFSLLVCLAGPLGSGCTSTPQRIALTVASGTEITVDEAMTLWGDYVEQFGATIAQEQAVSSCYAQYQAAFESALDAREDYERLKALGATDLAAPLSGAQDAAQALSRSLADLVKLLQRFGVKLATQP